MVDSKECASSQYKSKLCTFAKIIVTKYCMEPAFADEVYFQPIASTIKRMRSVNQPRFCLLAKVFGASPSLLH